jgi:hypothetical protein
MTQIANTVEVERKLARLKNYRTRYEVVFTNGTEKFLLLYTAMHSDRGLLAACRQRYDALLHITGGVAPYAAKSAGQFTGAEWRALFSGRTQREAIIDGELPFATIPKTTVEANRYDYKNQAWIVGGVYQDCGHEAWAKCDCFGRKHKGERAL